MERGPEKEQSQQVTDDGKKDPKTCNVAHGTQILCTLEHEVEGDTTFSYREHSLQ